MKRLCYSYIRHAGIIGAIYCAIPSIAWFVVMIVFEPFRAVYVLRIFLCLTFGCAIAAFLNQWGLDMWLIKHRGQDGPATVSDGTLTGAAIGVGSGLLPPLSSLILTNHLEMAKTFIIVTYLCSALVGGVFGTFYAVVGRKYIDRTDTEY